MNDLDEKIFEKEIRYYVDLDLASNAICGWGYDLREKLVNVKLKANQHRIYTNVNYTAVQYGQEKT